MTQNLDNAELSEFGTYLISKQGKVQRRHKLGLPTVQQQGPVAVIRSYSGAVGRLAVG